MVEAKQESAFREGLRHTNALFRKSLSYQSRQKGTNLCQVLTAVIVVVMMLIVQLIVEDLIADPPILNAQQLRYPPTRAPYLLQRHPDGEPECISTPDGPTPLLCNASTGLCPAQPAGVYNGDLWVISEPAMASQLGAIRGSGLLGQFSTDPLLVHRGFAIPEFQGGEVCLNADYWAYPVNFTSYTNQADIQAELYREYGLPGLPARLGGYRVLDLDISPGTKGIVRAAAHYNKTIGYGQDVPALSSLFVAAALKYFTGGAVTMEASGLRDFPRTKEGNDLDIIALFSPFLYIYVFQLTLPVMLTNLVFEKEANLLSIMKQMGLRMPAYWIVSYAFNYALYFVSTMFFWALAAIFGFRFFTANDPLIIFLLLFLFGHALVATVFFLRTLFSKTRTATVMGYLYIFSTGLLCSEIYYSYLMEPDTPSYVIRLFSIIPTLAFYRGIIALTNGVVFGEPGLEWKDINHERVQMGEVYIYLTLQTIFLLLLSVYLDNVLETGGGIKKGPLFFLDWFKKTPESGAGLGSGSGSGSVSHSMTGTAAEALAIPGSTYVETPIKSSVDGEPGDVAAWRSEIAQGDYYALRAADLTLTYPARHNTPPVEASKSVTFAIKAGTVFGMIGANGSGKSTTISQISGLLKPDSGTAHICGYDIRTQTHEAHSKLGICPQHDLLWDSLTGPEHVRFYARIKGLEGEELKTAVDTMLDDVALGDKVTRAKKASEYSGGMKRRLSMACAFIGNPDVVLLDEPTTGLDPASKQKVWEVIRTHREKAAILLTTHSLMETEELCDNVGIFIDGQFKTVGTVAELKERFTTGYKLGITVDAAEADAHAVAHAFVKKAGGPSTRLLNSLASVRNYVISRDVPLAKLYGKLAKGAERHKIVEWGLVHSSLEEVFLSIVEQYWEQGSIAVRAEAAKDGDIPLADISSSGYSGYSESSDEHESASSDWESSTSASGSAESAESASASASASSDDGSSSGESVSSST